MFSYSDKNTEREEAGVMFRQVNDELTEAWRL